MQTDATTSKFSAQVEQAEIDAWLDLYAAAPGLMAPSFDLDQHLVKAIVRKGLALGRRAS